MLLAALLFAVALPASADAAWRLTEDGQPLITNGFGGAAQVFVCPPGGAPCVETAWNTSEHGSQAFAPGETAVGTTFEVRTSYAPTDRSPAWQGQVAPHVPPAILWCGRACDTIIERGSPGSVIPDALVGHFVFVSQDPSPADRRGVPIPVLASPGGPWNADRPWDFKPGPRTRLSSPIGPIKPAFTLALRKRAYETGFHAEGTKAITSPSRSGRLTVRVSVDGRLERSSRVVAR